MFRQLTVSAVLLPVLMLSQGVARSQDFDKFDLWTNGTQLRGANITQRLVHPELDGEEFLGAGHLGPPYTQDDFNRLAALGANYVNISYAGLFTETPPYLLDEAIQQNLDDLLAMIANADMFAVISFRTGPGRSDFTFYRDGAGEWFDPIYLKEWVWVDQAAQDAWVEMWRYTAERYRDNPIVAAYDLMVEPNADEVILGEYDPEAFYAKQTGTLLDWHGLAGRITAAIREVDSETPLIVGAMGYSAAFWLPYLEVTDDARTVYSVHQYEPYAYTHQDPSDTPLTYPGFFDTDFDGTADDFNRDWLQDYIVTFMGGYRDSHGVPVTVNEFGLKRTVPDAPQFMDDQMAIFEDLGINYAMWLFHPAWEPYRTEENAFDFTMEPDLLAVITRYWSQNTLRPSSFSAES